MKNFIPISIISMLALAACETTNVATNPAASAGAEKTTETAVDCSSTPENPQCGEGGGPGPILRDSIDTTIEECTPTPENPQCGEGGGPGPIL